MRAIHWIVIHCSATPNGKDFHWQDIDRWHKERGWKGIGYHYVIPVSGELEKGRPLESVGAHVEGHNTDSIGICLIGTSQYSKDQWLCLSSLVTSLLIAYPGAKVCGHRDFPSVHKECPGFDVKEWMEREGIGE